MILDRQKEKNPMMLSGLSTKAGDYAEIAFIVLLTILSYSLSMVLFK